MPVRAVTLPATTLLVTGTSGHAPPPQARAVVHQALREAPGGRWGVLAPARTVSSRGGRPSLAAAGIADRWVSVLRDGRLHHGGFHGAGRTGRADPPAGVPASVAVLVLAEAVGVAAARSARIVELAPDDPDGEARAVTDLASCDIVVVAGGVPGDLAPGPSAGTRAVSAVVHALAYRGRWRPTVTDVVESGPHLPPAYPVTVWRD